MNKPYVYIEYPKCLYNPDGATINVDNREEEDNAAKMGWVTADKYFSYPVSAVDTKPTDDIQNGAGVADDSPGPIS